MYGERYLFEMDVAQAVRDVDAILDALPRDVADAARQRFSKGNQQMRDMYALAEQQRQMADSYANTPRPLVMGATLASVFGR